MRPSVIAHTLNGAFMLLAAILVFLYYSTVANLDTFRILILILLFGIIVGIHGLSHLGLEYVYGYSPYNMIFGRKKHECNCSVCPMMQEQRQHLKKGKRAGAEGAEAEGFQCPMMAAGQNSCPMMAGKSCALR